MHFLLLAKQAIQYFFMFKRYMDQSRISRTNHDRFSLIATEERVTRQLLVERQLPIELNQSCFTLNLSSKRTIACCLSAKNPVSSFSQRLVLEPTDQFS